MCMPWFMHFGILPSFSAFYPAYQFYRPSFAVRRIYPRCGKLGICTSTIYMKNPIETHLGREEINRKKKMKQRKKRLSAGDRNICYLNVFTRGSASSRMCIMHFECMNSNNVEHSATAAATMSATRQSKTQRRGRGFCCCCCCCSDDTILHSF